jgi:asparagine synthase (glutamine-hydrolysing)
MFSEVKTIKPGEILIIDSDTLKVKGQEQYCPKVFGDRVSIFGRSDLQNALIERTTGHSKFALSLSGGIDSAILAVEAKNLNLPVTAYSLRWDDSDKPKYNFDSENAQKIAKRLQIPFTVVSMPKVKEIPELIDTFIMAMEEPHSNPTGVSMLPLYSKIRNDGNRLVLTGDGADEIFGGYPRYNQAQNIKYFPQVNSKYLKNIIQARNFEKKILNKLAITFTECNSKEFWLYWHLIFGKHNFELLFPNSKQFEISPFTLRLNRYFGKNRVRSLMFTDLCTWLTMESNKKLDRISMWNSIEARSPFQSELVINTAYNSMNKSNFKIINKQILKDMYPELKTLPINSQKHGFISPLGHWLRSNPQLVQNSIRYLPQFLPINKSELIRLSQSIVKKNFNEMKMLWSLIILTRWFIKEFD